MYNVCIQCSTHCNRNWDSDSIVYTSSKREMNGPSQVITIDFRICIVISYCDFIVVNNTHACNQCLIVLSFLVYHTDGND